MTDSRFFFPLDGPAYKACAGPFFLYSLFFPGEQIFYKTATQSGVTQIAYQFCVPMVVTDVGGLSESVPDGRVGYVCEPTVQGVADAIARMYDGDTIERFRLNCIEERKRFSWEEMCTRIAELYEMVR